MKAVVARHGKLIVDTLPAPVPIEGKVLVKTLVCGICGSDLHALDHMDHLCESYGRAGLHPDAVPDPNKDMIFGHEFCAEVVDYGPGAKQRFKPGTRVCASPFQIGPYGPETVGLSNRMSGGFGEYMCLDESLLLAVPNGISSEIAALTEPLAVGVHAVNKADLKEGNVALVMGCGPIGLAVIAALKAKPNITIVASDFSAERRAIAKQLGADVVIDPGVSSPFASWKDLGCPAGIYDMFKSYVGGGKINRAVIFECVGIPGMLQQIISGAPIHATIVVVGVCMSLDSIEPGLAITKELDIRFSLAYSEQEFSDTLTGIAEGVYEVKPFISDIVGLNDVEKTFTQLQTDKTKVKVLIQHT